MDFAELTASCRREAGEPSADALRRGRPLWTSAARCDVLRQHPSDLQALEALPDPATWDPELPLPELHALRRRSMVSLAGFELSGELDLPAVADLQSCSLR
ncbi:MAG: hypothetical protein R3F62_02930 [Planctomycetota bacterium]